MKSVHLLAATAVLAASVATSASAQSAGETLFKQRCAVCHSIAPAPGKMGPPLKGVVGRKSGTVPGFAYSDAMKKANITWSTATLTSYLQAPAKMVPGTKMLISVPNPEQRAAVVQYLATQK